MTSLFLKRVFYNNEILNCDYVLVAGSNLIDKKLIVPGVVRVTAIREFKTTEPKE